MGRHKENNPAPGWFKLDAYANAREMDEFDWYLNLSLRSYVHRTQDSFWSKFVQTHPLLRRGEAVPPEFIFAESYFSTNFMDILHGGAPRSGVQPLLGTELYAFEKMLPSEVREFGAAFLPGKTSSDSAPKGFSGPVDHLFKRRFAGTFLRVDLTLTDAVLINDMREFLATKRSELKSLEEALPDKGVHPYRKALEKTESRKKPQPTVWALRKILALIDVEYWRDTTKSKFTDAEIQRLLDIDENNFRQARAEVSQLLDQFILDGWLLPSARKTTSPDAPDFP